MKSILVHLDASPRSAERLALAQRLARREHAELTALYAVASALLATPWAVLPGDASATGLLAEVDHAQRERARLTFEHATRLGPLTWLETCNEPVLWALRQQAFYSDLVVLGQTDPRDERAGALPADLVPAVVADTGKPTLVVPFAGSFEGGFTQVLVAWKPTREAARAVTAALPWLLQAHQLHLAWQPGTTAESDPLPALQKWLRLHGVHAPMRQHHLGPMDTGAALLSLAAETDADLLVMGCYGHHRLREWVLGGASRQVLQGMTLPVLMVH